MESLKNDYESKIKVLKVEIQTAAKESNVIIDLKLQYEG